MTSSEPATREEEPFKPPSKPYFAETTTYWFIYTGTGDRLCSDENIGRLTYLHCIAGLLVLALQMYASMMILFFTFVDYEEDQVPITINHGTCAAHNGYNDDDYGYNDDDYTIIFDDLNCDATWMTERAKIFTVFWSVNLIYAIYSTGPFINCYYVLKSICQSGLRRNSFALIRTMIALGQTLLFTLAGSYAIQQSIYTGNIVSAMEKGVGLLWIQDIDDKVWTYMSYLNYQGKENEEVSKAQVMKGFLFIAFTTVLVTILLIVTMKD